MKRAKFFKVIGAAVVLPSLAVKVLEEWPEDQVVEKPSIKDNPHHIFKEEYEIPESDLGTGRPFSEYYKYNENLTKEGILFECDSLPSNMSIQDSEKITQELRSKFKSPKDFLL